MPDFGDIEQEAKSHSSEVDKGIQQGDQELDKSAGGRDKGLIDKGAAEAEQQVGGQSQQGGQNPGQQPNQ